MAQHTPVGVSAIFFFVADPARTERFYRDVMGLDMTWMDADGDHPAFVTAELGSVSLVFYPGDEGTAGSSPVVVFGLDGGIQDAVDALVRHNVEIVTPVSEAPDGGLTADFLDPDGHMLSYHQPAEIGQ